ncbi:hypothetical protein BDC45DRAFT_515105 [Circinella umbellata]|nr:hypothetical protein BDC45DRAFT_515105 [Circinella umbellata]
MVCRYHFHSSRSNQALPIKPMSTPVNSIAPVNLTGHQCSWCGKFGHKRVYCPYLK